VYLLRSGHDAATNKVIRRRWAEERYRVSVQSEVFRIEDTVAFFFLSWDENDDQCHGGAAISGQFCRRRCKNGFWND
jgi:hypothetical protein